MGQDMKSVLRGMRRRVVRSVLAGHDDYAVLRGDMLRRLRLLPDNSVDSVVCDPPYGISFMGRNWDHGVPGVAYWTECLRVLKPGGHLVAFGGSRTFHRIAVAIEDAGFEIRDNMLYAWCYGCLSEDSEVLTRHGWEPYHRAKNKEILAYDPAKDIYKWEEPSGWFEYRVESDSAFRIQSDTTDQIVSRGHRCLVVQNGGLVFSTPDSFSGVAEMPTLPQDFCGVHTRQEEVLLPAVQRVLQGSGLEEVVEHRQQYCLSSREREETPKTFRKREPRVEGGRDVLQKEGQVRRPRNKVCAMSEPIQGHGEERRICDGTSACGCTGRREAVVASGVCSSHQPQSRRQPFAKSDDVCDERRSQTVRARATYQTSLATVTQIYYTGIFFCPTVSTGAFVARRKGKVFLTGNSGFPKSMNVSKAIDKAAGAKRKVVSSYEATGSARTLTGHNYGGSGRNVEEVDRIYQTAPATTDAQRWNGFGTALKPAMEPIIIARKPLSEPTVAKNVLKWGTGAINIDGCRVGIDGGTRRDGKADKPNDAGWENMRGHGIEALNAGRWPANLLLQHSAMCIERSKVWACVPGCPVREMDRQSGKLKSGKPGIRRKPHETTAMAGRLATRNGVTESGFGDTGGASRFFYCAKAAGKERHAGLPEGQKNTHPTVKPIAVMRYLCRLVTPPGGVVVDPFCGSGSTLCAARLEGFRAIGIDLDSEGEYCAIAEQRVAYWSSRV